MRHAYTTHNLVHSSVHCYYCSQRRRHIEFDSSGHSLFFSCSNVKQAYTRTHTYTHHHKRKPRVRSMPLLCCAVLAHPYLRTLARIHTVSSHFFFGDTTHTDTESGPRKKREKRHPVHNHQQKRRKICIFMGQRRKKIVCAQAIATKSVHFFLSLSVKQK